MLNESSIGYEVHSIASAILLVCVVLLCLALFMLAVSRRRPSANWSSCGRCGYAVTLGASRCAECGSDYARVGIMTRAMEQRMRVSPWIAGFAWTVLTLVLLRYTVLWFESAFPSMERVRTHTSLTPLLPYASRGAEVIPRQMQVNAITYETIPERDSAVWYVADTSRGTAIGRVEIDLASQRFTFFDANDVEIAAVGADGLDQALIREWLRVEALQPRFEAEVIDRLVDSTTRNLGSMLSEPHEVARDVLRDASWGPGELMAQGGSLSTGLIMRTDLRVAWRIGVFLVAVAVVWALGIVQIYRRQRVQPHALQAPA